MLERWLHDTDMAGSNGTPMNLNNNTITNGQTHNALVTSQPHIQSNCTPNLISPGIESICKRRKKRTSIETQVRASLERAFMCNQKPTFEEIAELADKLNMEKEVVSVESVLLFDWYYQLGNYGLDVNSSNALVFFLLFVPRSAFGIAIAGENAFHFLLNSNLIKL